jgi:ABC-type transport system involved in multi-copper enzyme maturation permease subunit
MSNAATADGETGVRSFASRITGLSPFGPIFGKELRVTSRRKRSYILRVIYLAALLLVLLMAWMVSREFMRYGGGGVGAQAMAQEQLGVVFFGCFVIFTTIAMAAIAPLLTANCISSERLGRTLHVLLMTPITAWQIVAGKLFSRLLIAMTLIGLSLPVLALSRLLGGIELEQMIAAVCLAATVALFTAAIGLFYSAFLKRVVAVIVLAYITIIVFEVLTGWFASAFRMQTALQVAASTNWVVCMGMIATPQRLITVNWQLCCAFHLALTGILLIVSGQFLRRVARNEGGAGAPDAPEKRPAFVATPPPLPNSALMAEIPAGVPAMPIPVLPVSSAPVHRPRALREVSDSPILWREIRRPLTAKRWQAITFTALTLLACSVRTASPPTIALWMTTNCRWGMRLFSTSFSGCS